MIATVVPIFKPVLNSLEIKRLNVSIESASPADFFLVGPATLDWHYYTSKWPAVNVEVFREANFRSVASYNAWMLGEDLYTRFQDYEFVLICQTDAILTERLDPRTWDFDYLGAVWEPPIVASWDPIRRTVLSRSFGLNPRKLEVGNGGLSIRRTQAFLAFVKSLPRMGKKANEDVVISYFSSAYNLRCASPELAAQTFMEAGAQTWEHGRPLPAVSGFHALNRFNPQLEDFILRSRA